MNNKKAVSKIIEYKNISVFTDSLNQLIGILYPNHFLDIEDNKLHFKLGNDLDGVIVNLYSKSIHLKLSYSFIRNHFAFQENIKLHLPEINTLFNYNVNLQHVYLYPNERDNFPDTTLGMEDRAAYFLRVLQVALGKIIIISEQ